MIKKITLFILLFGLFSFGQSDTAIKKWGAKLNQGIDLYKAQEFDKAEKLFEKSYELAKEIFTGYNKQIEKNINYLTKTYWNNKEYKKMLPILIWQIDQIKKTKGDDNHNYYTLLNNLGMVYKRVEDYDNAKPLLIEAFNYSKNKEGKQSKNYQDRLNSVFNLYYESEDYKNAIPLNIELIDITKTKYGVEHEYHLEYLKRLSSSYYEINNYQKAKEAYTQRRFIFERLSKTKTKEYHFILQYLTLCNENLGNYEEGLKNHQEILEISKVIHGELHEDYYRDLIYFAEFYMHFGKFSKAISILNENLKKIERNFGEDHFLSRDCLYQLGGLYFKLGNYPYAEMFFDEALERTEKYLGINHYMYCRILNGIALVYQGYESSHYDKKAIKAYDKVIELTEINNRTNHTDYTLYLTNKAGIYLNSFENEKALSLYLKAQEINSENSRKDDNILLNNLAIIYGRLNENEKSQGIYKESLKITAATHGKNSKEYRISLNNFAFYYEKQKQYVKAKPLIIEANNILVEEIAEVFRFGNLKDKKIFLKNVLDQFEFNQEFAFLSDFKFDDINEMNLNNQLILKGLLLNSSRKMFTELISLNNIDINKKISDYKVLNKKLNDLTHLGRSNYNDVEDEKNDIQFEIQKLESKLVKNHTENFKGEQFLLKDWRNIKETLNKNEIAIEFSFFNNSYDTSEKGNSNESYYVYTAYIIKKEWEHPKVKMLFKQEELITLLENKSPNNLYAVRGSEAINIDYSNKEIYNLIWLPLEPYLNDVKKIYFSPVGLLNNIPFHAISNSNEFSLLDNYDLVQLSSTSIISKSLTEPKINDIILIGGVDYEFDISKGEFVKNKRLGKDYDINANGKLVKKKRKYNKETTNYWSFLDGTLEEIEGIKKIFNKTNKVVELIKGGNATEEILKEMDTKSPSILHLSTHGFYHPKDFFRQKSNDLDNPYDGYTEPLLRSGLIFAGANQFWRYNRIPKGVDDGTLSGLEISSMDLSNTDMVVLSACETGLGDIDGSEGVYGLQRAFKMAGVDIIVMSLWQVPDKETAEFMNLFYSSWLGDMKVREAFRSTQRTMSNKHKNNPEKWAAFVLFE